MTPGQSKALAITLAQAALTDLSFDQASALIESSARLVHLVKELQIEFAGRASIEFTVDGTKYRALCLHRPNERSIHADVLARRASEIETIANETQAERFIRFGDQIPEEVRDRILFFFTDWHPEGDRSYYYAVGWNNHHQRWEQFTVAPLGNLHNGYRVIVASPRDEA